METIEVNAGEVLHRDFVLPGRFDTHLMQKPPEGMSVDYALSPPMLGTYPMLHLGPARGAPSDTIDAQPGIETDTLITSSGWYGLHVYPQSATRLWLTYRARPGVRIRDVRIVDDVDVLVADFCGAKDYPESGELTWERWYGHYMLPPPGPYHLIVETTAGREVMPFYEAWTRYRSDPTGNYGDINGTVVDTTGAPMPYANVSVVGAHLGTMTDKAGRFHITGVHVGEQLVRIHQINYDTRDFTVHVSFEGSAELRLALGAAHPTKEIYGTPGRGSGGLGARAATQLAPGQVRTTRSGTIAPHTTQLVLGRVDELARVGGETIYCPMLQLPPGAVDIINRRGELASSTCPGASATRPGTS
jgi:hypothetical protein